MTRRTRPRPPWAAALERDGNCCQRCGTRLRPQAHRKMGADGDTPAGWECLCAACHESEHDHIAVAWSKATNTPLAEQPRSVGPA